MIAEKKGLSGCLKFFIFFTSIVIFFIIAVGLFMVFIYLNSLPTLEELTPSPIAQTSKVYALDGSLITEFHAEENREIVKFSNMSPFIKDAVVAVEDKRFFDHQGVDYVRIFGAMVADIRAGDLAQGGSTITQQYVKNVYFTFEKTFRRKINEALTAVQLERNYTKEKILEMYLNTILFGNGAYGIEKASEIYFGVDARDLTLPQAALLAGLVQAPEVHSPFNDLENSKLRRDHVLKLMYEQEFIGTQEYLDALAAPIILNNNPVDNTQFASRIAPYFVDFIKQQLYDQKFTDYDVFKGGLRIYTTLDIDLQDKAETAVKNIFPEEIDPSYSLISIDPANGYIYALIGGKDYGSNKFNIATQGKRQPGSVFKTLVLMESIRQNISPSNTFNPNGPITIDMEEGPDWIVDNYGGQKFEDEMSVTDGTIYSVNVVYAQLMMRVGAENVEKLCNEMEIYDIGNNPAIALGGLEVGITPLDISKVFQTLASSGTYRQPVSILKITDPEGNILYEYDPDAEGSTKKILEEPEAYYVTQILQKVIESGTGRGANIGRPAFGKTGTTSDLRDAWFAGGTPDLVTVVWIGHTESNQPMEPINDRVVVGGTYPADIWREYMLLAHEGKQVSNFKVPDGELTGIEICTESGLLPVFWCPDEVLEWQIFTDGKEPDTTCDIHNKVEAPDVVGLSLEEAMSIFEELNIVPTEIIEFDSTYNQNIIFEQDPEAGSTLESLTGEELSITIYISKGEKTFEMPGLIGLDLSMAEDIINSLELVLEEVIHGYDSTQPPDIIFGQEPVPGSKITSSTKVTLFISQGENPEGTVPEVTGMTEEEALGILNFEGYFNITITIEESEDEISKVFSQVPEIGTVYEKANEVVLRISSGIGVPDVIGLDLADALIILEGLDFLVEILPDPGATGEIIGQIPAAGEFLNYGSTISIEVTEPIEGGDGDGDGDGDGGL